MLDRDINDQRYLNVWFNTSLIGQLKEHKGLWLFEYAQDWKGFDLCSALPAYKKVLVDGSSHRPVQWFFDNLLPEEGARYLLAKDADVDQADAFSLLEHFGSESAGALTLLKSNEQPGVGSTTPLLPEELSKRIQDLPNVSLSQGSSKRMSLAGAQHKLPVIFKGNQLFEPSVAMPSTHILKPNHSDPNSYPHSVVNEYVMMRLARKLGLDVPDVNLVRVPEPVYLVKRFDRVTKSRLTRRLHVLDACQLLSIDRVFKYQQCKEQSLERIVSFSRQKASARQKIYSWFVFNLIIGNTDNHLKNLSFYAESGDVTLCPFYDLLCTAIYESRMDWKQASLVWPIGDAKTLGQVTRKDLLQFAGRLKLSDRYANNLIDKMRHQCQAAFKEIAQEFESLSYDGLSKAGELRFLRLLEFTLIKEMSEQLG